MQNFKNYIKQRVPEHQTPQSNSNGTFSRVECLAERNIYRKSGLYFLLSAAVKPRETRSSINSNIKLAE